MSAGGSVGSSVSTTVNCSVGLATSIIANSYATFSSFFIKRLIEISGSGSRYGATIRGIIGINVSETFRTSN